MSGNRLEDVRRETGRKPNREARKVGHVAAVAGNKAATHSSSLFAVPCVRLTDGRMASHWRTRVRVVRDRVADEGLFFHLVRHIREHGYERRFYDRVMTYFDEDGMTY